MSDKNIGKNIRKLRDHAGFNQANLAQFLHVDQSFISKVEKGERPLSADMVEKLAALFGVSAGALEEPDMKLSDLSIAFRGSDVTFEDMESISAVNRIALNMEFMEALLRGEE